LRPRSVDTEFTFSTANAVFGGITPAVLPWLIVATGNPMAPGWYLAATGVIALVVVLLAKETARKALDD
jgi:MFS transporter, MHS family, proline/betaine transporter